MPGDLFEKPVLDLRNRSVSVIGAARSGIAAAQALMLMGARVLLSDRQPAERIGAERLDSIARAGIPFVPGASVQQALPDSAELVVTSPGVWRTADVLVEAVNRAIPIWSEIELAYRISPSRMIATTGTNGKSTTTLLIAEILRSSGADAVVAGNISADEIKKTLVESAREALEEDAVGRVLVAEISSFQLEWVERFAPWIGLLLNVTNDHMDRYADFTEYFGAKAHLFEHQGETDWALLNYDDAAIRSYEFNDIRSRRVWISTEQIPGGIIPKAYSDAGMLVVELQAGLAAHIMPISEIPDMLPGRHSVFNVLAASTAATIAGVEPWRIAESVRKFKGVPHRMELVAEIRGVRWINNSMCTNVCAFAASLEAIGRPATIIAGGADKEMDFSPLATPLKQYAQRVILIGTAADKMEAAFRAGGYNSIERACTLEAAVTMAAKGAIAGEAMVLSPGCASFDMFRDFEARGAAFRAAVKQLL